MKRAPARPRGPADSQKQVEAALAEKLRLQKLLADLSSRFVALPSAQVDAAIEDTQRLIVETLGLDRSRLWQLNDSGDSMALTHSWQRPGWPELSGTIPLPGRLPWLFSEVMAGRTVQFSCLEDLPPEAAADVEVFRQYGLKASLTFPLMVHGRTSGALAFGTLDRTHKWREDEIVELKLVAQIIGNVVSRERAELREEQMREELAHAMRGAALGEMVAALAHELNQPLAAILSNAQAARRFLASGDANLEELRDILADIVRDNKRAGAVIHNLRAMVSKRPPPRESCDLNELAMEVAGLLRSEFIDAKIELRLGLAAALPSVQAVRVELQQVLVNLLLNALNVMRETLGDRPWIDLQTRVTDRFIEVTVHDHGHGIAEDSLERIFEPFVSSKADGLGMGLSITRRIIENHAGRIAARNNDDGGASFCFALPIATAET